MSGTPSGLLPPTNNSALGHGAVGGARGVGAALIQVLYNVTYNRGNLAAMAADFQKFEADRIAANQQLGRARSTEANLEQRVAAARRNAAQINRNNATDLNRIAALQTRINSLTQQQARNGAQVGHILARERAEQTAIFQAITAATGLTEKQIRDAARLVALQNQLAGATANTAAAAQVHAVAVQQATRAQQAQAALSNLMGGAASRVGALGLGLIGGIVGGAVISGAIMGPLQAFMDVLSQGLEDIIDPANKAREALADVAESVDSLTEPGKVGRLEAATKAIKELGDIGALAGLDPELLALAATLNEIGTEIEETSKALETQNRITDLINEKIRDEAELLARTAGSGRSFGEVLAELTANGDAAARDMGNLNLALDGNYSALQLLAAQGSVWAQNILAQADALVRNRIATDEQTVANDALAASMEEAAAAAAALSAEMAAADVASVFADNISRIQAVGDDFIDGIRTKATGAIDAIRRAADAAAQGVSNTADQRIEVLQDRLSNLELRPSSRTRGLEAQLEALKDAGPSRQTNALAAAIERLNRAQEQSQHRAALAEIAEQKRLVMLRERLRLTDKEINIENYQGEARLIAIDARLEQMRKQNEAQDRFNKLLDIQYQLSQGVNRQEGESIRQFIERRAQRNRELLQEAAELRRRGPEQELMDERARVEYEIELRELAEQRKKLIADRARELHMRDLQERLRASQERDREELESRRESLQRQLEASRAADQEALENRREALQNQIEAVRENAAREIESINAKRDADIAAVEHRRDVDIRNAQFRVDMAIAAEEKRAEEIKQISDQSENDRLVLAIQGARSMAELQAFAGRLAGAQYALNFLLTSGQFYSLDPLTRAQILNNLFDAVRAYGNRLADFNGQLPGQSFNGRTSHGGFAEGGVFRLNNTNTPFGRDVRWGDGQGDELGVILSNKVVQQLRDGGGPGGALVGGNMIIQTSEDPYRARYQWRQEIKQMIREEIRH